MGVTPVITLAGEIKDFYYTKAETLTNAKAILLTVGENHIEHIHLYFS